ncbi:MAG: NUDIX hydrolase [Patescibacteria group bacterium]
MKKNLTKVAFVYLQKDNKILLLQEGGRLSMGLWCFPGGHVDPGETFEQAAIREVQEESGYQVTVGKIIHRSLVANTEYKGSKGDTDEVELLIFEGNIIGGELRIDNQALDIKWLSPEEALALPLRWGLLKNLLLAIPPFST